MISSVSGLSEFVLLYENRGANPARKQTLETIIHVQVRLSVASALAGSFFSGLRCDVLCTDFWGEKGALGAVFGSSL